MQESGLIGLSPVPVQALFEWACLFLCFFVSLSFYPPHPTSLCPSQGLEDYYQQIGLFNPYDPYMNKDQMAIGRGSWKRLVYLFVCLFVCLYVWLLDRLAGWLVGV